MGKSENVPESIRERMHKYFLSTSIKAEFMCSLDEAWTGLSFKYLKINNQTINL